MLLWLKFCSFTAGKELKSNNLSPPGIFARHACDPFSGRKGNSDKTQLTVENGLDPSNFNHSIIFNPRTLPVY
jgi:hypothetical protein